MSYKGKKKSSVYFPEEGYDLYAKFYDESLEYLDSFEKEFFYKMIGDLSGKRVLDIGCGTGRTIGKLSGAGIEIVGCDISSEMLETAKKKFTNVDFNLGDIENLPFDDESFDVVIAMFVIVHLKDLQHAFNEVYRVLKDGGIFILSNINQKKAPKLKMDKGEIVIKSHYHNPKNVIKALNDSFFKIDKEEMVFERGVWINQIIKAVK